jgi:hypothetical protein
MNTARAVRHHAEAETGAPPVDPFGRLSTSHKDHDQPAATSIITGASYPLADLKTARAQGAWKRKIRVVIAKFFFADAGFSPNFNRNIAPFSKIGPPIFIGENQIVFNLLILNFNCAASPPGSLRRAHWTLAFLPRSLMLTLRGA